jgi:hypothetical protein
MLLISYFYQSALIYIILKMNHLACRLLFILLIFTGTDLLAQGTYTISGTVTNEEGNPVQGATVFISGAQKITATNAAGEFTFVGMAAGNYLISTKMLGYAAPAQAITLHDQSLKINIKLKVKAITLNEVNITTAENRKLFYDIFKDQFLGKSVNQKKCVILNPEILYFTSQKLNQYDLILKAEADDLLLIENKVLGYRIKYLLRSFQYNSKTHITSYDGDSSFEEMEGTVEQKKIWGQNRLSAYQGSLMHFLRSVYANNVIGEGFVANQMVKSSNVFNSRAYIDPKTVQFARFVTRVDSSFVSYKFNALNISYQPKKAAKLEKQALKTPQKDNEALTDQSNEAALLPLDATGKSSQLLLYLKEAVIDVRGSVSTGYQTFLIRGYWAEKRIGEQLPFEYLPLK